MYSYAHTQTCMPVCLLMCTCWWPEADGRYNVFSSIDCSLSYFLRQALSLNLKLVTSVRLADQRTPENMPVSVPPVLGSQVPACHHT